MLKFSALSAGCVVAFLSVAPVLATTVSDPVDDFLPTYTGPRNGDLDVISITVTTNGSAFTISATLNGAIGTTTGGRYIWGINRGRGTAGFASIGLNNVLFDTIIALNNDGTGVLNLLNGTPATALNAISIAGNSISVVVPYSLLPSTGFDFGNYGFNLWPRSPGAGNAFLADFAPNNGVIVTPEPAAIALFGLGFAGLALARRRKSLRF